MKAIHKYFLFTGFAMICLSIIMFLIAIGMFTARGDYSQFIIKIGDFFYCMVSFFSYRNTFNLNWYRNLPQKKTKIDSYFPL